ncbi:MAG: glycosyltransferase, partial [Tannerellaceae bacterium]|nr:glycosyltransferase [Tannerellaceae bacterium]
TDQSATIIKTFCDTRILYIENRKRKGNYICRNTGCKLAKGKYIFVMDADDVAIRERIEKQVLFMESNPTLIACGSFFKTFDGHIHIKSQEYETIKIYLLYNNMFLHPSLIVRRDILKEIEFYDESFPYSADYNLCCQLALKGKIINIPEPLLFYRFHSEQITCVKNKQQKEYADIIRINYLRANGFKLTLDQEILFTHLMTHVKFTTMDELQQIYILYQELMSQNEFLKSFTPTAFETFLKIRIKESCITM